MNNIKVGIDAGKEKVVCAYRSNGAGEVRVVTLANRKEAVKPWVERLQQGGVVQACYEASSVGYEMYRWLAELGAECEVVAPSLIPKRPGDHVKTDVRDAKELLTLFEAGLLTSVRVPTVAEEALRDLVRSRGDILKSLTMNKHRLNQFMQRHGRIYPGASHWTLTHLAWLSKQIFTEAASQKTAELYRRWVDQAQAELERVETMIREMAPQHKDTYALAERMMSFHGIDVMSGVSLASELLDVRRFSKAGQLMSFTGLTGREYSSAEVVRRGSITKTGNSQVRHVLIQAAWKYTRKPTESKRLREHWKSQPAAVAKIAQKAKDRLHRRFLHLTNKGKLKQKAVVAIARELAGFLWAAAHVEARAA
jgi:transposase